ncbi:hypothetical protein CY34DRAFT_448723 [Suillus luteus UH-Slu-Lm8-n1]|uniref:Uncharacterized protein n=1 Tax=Suillus luteus UH-Slu-Lm8-n1 TaxID=930992 RepID=A0A0D0A7V2_9AGAM|nr:hypothetical protein CY34DRAFT_448723 [Suillus luteus UH-Slu-Lm8-n1]
MYWSNLMNLKSSHFFKLHMHCDHDAEPSSDPKQYSQSRPTMTITLSFVPFQNVYQGSQVINVCRLSPRLRVIQALSQTSSRLLRPMRFSFLAVLVALTASMYVSATPSVFSRSCRAVGKVCEQGSDCCSDACAYKSDCSGKVCIDDDSILIEELVRREIDC